MKPRAGGLFGVWGGLPSGGLGLAPACLTVLLLCPSRCVHGKCVPLDALSYSCQCQDGYSGALCNQAGAPADPCGGLRCLRGHCQASATKGAHCVCDPGFSGELCEQGQGPPS